MKRLGWVFGLQTRLIVASAATVMLAILVTGAVFIYRDRQEQRREALQHIAAATEVFSFSAANIEASSGKPASVTSSTPSESGVPESGVAIVGGGFKVQQLETEAKDAIIARAARTEYRIILVDEAGTVVNDPAGTLSGTQITYPSPGDADTRRGYVTWPGGPSAAANITFLAPTQARSIDGSGLKAVAAIDSRSLASDWLAIVPDLGLSGLVGLPVAVLAVVLVTRRVTQPLRQLTYAADGMSRGDFDQRVEVKGHDEVATLAASFTVMAGRVKDRDIQLRSLIANVSHDLRTPLTSIQGYAEALVDGVADKDGVDRAARIIRDEARHASDLLANLLGLSEIEGGEVIVQSAEYDFVAVAARCIRRLQPRADEQDLHFELDAPETLMLKGDVEKTERALCNVIENAVKFGSSQVAVTLSTEAGNAVASVRNDGPPIPPAAADRIFERFYHGQGPGSGTSLGLAIAHELALVQGGSLTLASTAPVEFILKLPVPLQRKART